MKICLLGSAPSSVNLAPFGDPETLIWACSPGTYYQAPRVDAFFELHRCEVGQIGKPATQKPWFSPEYVAWMGQQKLVWVAPKALQQWLPHIPSAQPYPIEEMEHKFGTYWWTSSLSYMMAMAIDQILAEREKDPGHDNEKDLISLYGVDMAADEEYGYQRAGCQFFMSLAATLGIRVWIPPESDVMRPMPRYAIDESEWWHIKGLERLRELEARQAQAAQTEAAARANKDYLAGAISDHKYHMQTWMADRTPMGVNAGILGASPAVLEIARARAGITMVAPSTASVDLSGKSEIVWPAGDAAVEITRLA
jgi:hypothetical protein